MKKLFTSESVTEGHPDKICDQISDAILDAILAEDKNGRVAAETTVNTGYAMVMGEISTSCYIDIQNTLLRWWLTVPHKAITSVIQKATTALTVRHVL